MGIGVVGQQGVCPCWREVDNPSSWDIEALYRQLFTIFPVPESINIDTLERTQLDEMEESLIEAAHAAYEQKIEEIGELMPIAERQMMLRALDMHWQRHLTDLDMLREGIGLMAIAQRDPLVEYQREAFNMFRTMQSRIDGQALQYIFRVQVPQVQKQPVQRQMRAIRPDVNGSTEKSKPEPARASKKPGRNDPCWCGSGKKYKHCHYKLDKQAERVSN